MFLCVLKTSLWTRPKAAAYNWHFLRIYFSALAEFDQNTQITILPTLQWADIFFAPGSIYLFTCVEIPSDQWGME
jgi:hypothetical protein